LAMLSRIEALLVVHDLVRQHGMHKQPELPAFAENR
jgi:hypothetical protein